VIRIGLAGLGYWGPNLARNFDDLADLVWLCDASSEVLERFGARYPDARTTTSFDEMLADDSLDAVVVATPVPTHYELARLALQSGKHVLVEKPLATRAREAAELASIAERSRLTLMVDHIFLYEPAVRHLRDLIGSGALGEMRYIHGERLNFGRVQTTTNALWSLAPQDVSIVLYLLDAMPVAVQANGIECLGSGFQDVVFLKLVFAGGLEAHVHVSWLDPEKQRRLTLVGSQKMAVYDDLRPAKISIFERSATVINNQPVLRDGGVETPDLPSVEPLRAMAAEFVRSCLDHAAPLTGARNGVDVVAVLEAAHESLVEGGTLRRVTGG
jgi:predicted dehydrogenase